MWKVKPDGSVAQEWTITSESGQTSAVTAASVGSMAARWFYGWNVVAAAFVMAMLSFGLGFYGVTLGGVVIVPALPWLIGRSASRVPGDGVQFWPATGAWVRYI